MKRDCLRCIITLTQDKYKIIAQKKNKKQVKTLLVSIPPSIFQETESLLNLLLGVETQSSTQSPGEPEELKSHVSQRLQRELTSFFNLLLLRLTHTTDRLNEFTQKVLQHRQQTQFFYFQVIMSFIPIQILFVKFILVIFNRNCL